MIRPAFIPFLFCLSISAFPKQVRVPGEDFSIGATEVTNAEYEACVAAGACSQAHYNDGLGHFYDGVNWPAGKIPEIFQRSNHPVVCVDWHQAKTYCTFAGMRLPTEAEWEKAATAGSDDTTRVWWRLNSGLVTHPVGQKKPNAHGIYDLCGNVWEWCQDGFDDSLKAFRGGSWVSDSASATVKARKGAHPASPYNNNGFRCVK